MADEARASRQTIRASTKAWNVSAAEVIANSRRASVRSSQFNARDARSRADDA